ncbi:ankyrin repeat-containing protein NPR4-like isoform X1 [Senna tora]|uniref:Ankyrin repeat-containing protein NPR4-like isoform X1 n=1 Tax=Senna tora TaxID=362788 RepID=A0A834TE32_9FABA|nr:ankyrin repeat-containing protein NPR4-like isoform X1 [Senna tora]
MEEQGEINDESYRAYNEIVGEALRNETYEYWFECVRNYLIGRDVWEVVDGGFAKPPEDGKKKEIVRWRRKNGIALHAILISCGTEAAFSHHISQVSEAKVAWDILNHIYNYSSSELESEAEAEFVFASPIHPSTMRGEEVNYDASDLYKAIRGNNWNATKAFLEVHPNALTAKLTTFGHTPLHVAASFGHVRMVEQLVEFAQSPLEIIADDHGFTPLATSALYGGDPRIAQCMLNRNSDLIGIPNRLGALPVTLAFLNGHKEMGRYLYSLTPLELLRQNDGTQGIKILTQCFNLGELGEDKDNDGQIPIMKIAGMSSAFSSGSELVFWKRWIYNC